MSKSQTNKKSDKPLAIPTESRIATIERLFGTVKKEFLKRPMEPALPNERKEKVPLAEEINKILLRALREQSKIKLIKKEVRDLANSRR